MNNTVAIVENIDMVPFFTKGANVEDVLTAIEKEAESFVPDVSTAKGRDAIKAMVTKVTKSKTYLESKGKDLAAEYKAIPKLIDENRRLVKDRLTALAENIRNPLTEYELEQVRINNERIAAEKAVKLAAEVEEAQEFAILMNEKFDIEREKEIQAQQEAEKARKAQEQALKEREIAEAVEHERLASIEREKALKLQIENAELKRIEAEKQAALNAEQSKKDAINAEKARIEAESLAQANADRAREADKKHASAILRAAKEALVELGLTEESAKMVINAIRSGKVPNVSIKF